MASPRLLIGRFSQPGAVYTVTTVIRNRSCVLHGAVALMVAEELRRGTNDGRLESLAWVVMPDHVHWLLQLRSLGLSRCVQSFKSRSARAVNGVLGRNGSLWQSGFYDHRLRADDDLRVQAGYIAANPVRAGLVGRIQDWPYSWSRWSQEDI